MIIHFHLNFLVHDSRNPRIITNKKVVLHARVMDTCVFELTLGSSLQCNLLSQCLHISLYQQSGRAYKHITLRVPRFHLALLKGECIRKLNWQQ